MEKTSTSLGSSVEVEEEEDDDDDDDDDDVCSASPFSSSPFLGSASSSTMLLNEGKRENWNGRVQTLHLGIFLASLERVECARTSDG